MVKVRILDSNNSLKDALKRYELTKSRRYEIDPVDREPEIETGFRIPNLPGFKGKPIRTKDGKTIMVDSWIVESEIANKIEQILKWNLKYQT